MNTEPQPDLFGELLIETIPYSQFQDRLAELELAGYRVSSVGVDHKKGQYRVVAVTSGTVFQPRADTQKPCIP